MSNQSRRSAPRAPPRPERDILDVTMSRYRDLNPNEVRITLRRSGAKLIEVSVLTLEEILHPEESKLQPTYRWLSGIELEELYEAVKAAKEEEILLNRRSKRLPEERSSVALENLSQEEIRILRMTQKAWNAFRPSVEGHE